MSSPDFSIFFISFFALFFILNLAYILWHSCSNSPESGLGTSHTSLPGADSDPDQYDGQTENEYYEAESLPTIGTCRALYPFEGKNMYLISNKLISFKYTKCSMSLCNLFCSMRLHNE